MNLYLNAGLTLSEKFSLSAEIMLQGMGTVFMVLILLWGILALFGKVFSNAGQKSAQTSTESAPTVEKTVAQEQQPVATAENNDGALIAAISAAIEAYRAEEGKSNIAFRVVSFRQKKGAQGWMGTDNQ